MRKIFPTVMGLLVIIIAANPVDPAGAWTRTVQLGFGPLSETNFRMSGFETHAEVLLEDRMRWNAGAYYVFDVQSCTQPVGGSPTCTLVETQPGYFCRYKHMTTPAGAKALRIRPVKAGPESQSVCGTVWGATGGLATVTFDVGPGYEGGGDGGGGY